MRTKYRKELCVAQLVLGAMLVIAGLASTALASGGGTCGSAVTVITDPQGAVILLAVACETNSCATSCGASWKGADPGEDCEGCLCAGNPSSTICEAYTCQKADGTTFEDCLHQNNCVSGICILDWTRTEDVPSPGFNYYVYYCVCQ